MNRPSKGSFKDSTELDLVDQRSDRRRHSYLRLLSGAGSMARIPSATGRSSAA